MLSPTHLNRRSPVVVLAPLTSQNTQRLHAHEALIPAGDGAPRESKALLGQIRSLSKSRILAYHGHISDDTMTQVDAAHPSPPDSKNLKSDLEI